MNAPVTPAVAGRAPRGRLQLILLATLFFFPLVASYALYFLFPDMRPSGTVNYGELLTPIQTLPENLGFANAKGEVLDTAAFVNRRWTFVVVANEDCDEACVRALIMTRQVRALTNEKRSRVQRVLVLKQAGNLGAIAARLAPEHPDLHVITETGDTGQKLSAILGAEPASINLLDPHGNWVMRYPGGRDTQSDFKGISKDLAKLLRLSQIG